MDLLECIAFVLLRDNTVLAERRKLTKKVMPGAIALPGGHMEDDESPEDTLRRELQEELGIVPHALKITAIRFAGMRLFRKATRGTVKYAAGVEIGGNGTAKIVTSARMA